MDGSSTAPAGTIQFRQGPLDAHGGGYCFPEMSLSCCADGTSVGEIIETLVSLWALIGTRAAVHYRYSRTRRSDQHR